MSDKSYWLKYRDGRLNRRRLLQSGAALSAGAAALALAGCGGDDDNDGASGGGTSTTTPSASGQPTQAAAGTPRRGGKYTITFGSVGNNNIVEFFHAGWNITGVTVYDRPITVSIDDGYALAAAESIELVEPTKVVMTLRDGMVYHDKAPVNGRPVVASDIAATQEYVKANEAAQDSNFQRLFLDRMEAPDDRTVIWHLTKPTAYLFSSTYLANPTGQPIIPKEMLDTLDEAEPIGSGPFVLTDSIFNARYTFDRFDGYRDADRIYFDQRESLGIGDPVAQETAFRGGELTYWEPLASAVDRLTNELDPEKFQKIEFLDFGLNGFNAMMNKDEGGPRPWHDIRFREALYRLTDKQQIIDLTLDGKGVAPPGPMHASLPDYQLDPSDTEKFFKIDVAEANKLLDAANYDRDQTWTIFASTTSAINAQLGEVWHQQLGRAGIKVLVTPLPLAELVGRMSRSEYDIFVGGTPGLDIPFRALRHQHSTTGFPFSNCGLFDPEIDALIERSETEIDKDEHIRLVKDIQMRVLEAYSASYVWFTQQQFAFYDKRLQDFHYSKIGGQFYGLDAWFAE